MTASLQSVRNHSYPRGTHHSHRWWPPFFCFPLPVISSPQQLSLYACLCNAVEHYHSSNCLSPCVLRSYFTIPQYATSPHTHWLIEIMGRRPSDIYCLSLLAVASLLLLSTSTSTTSVEAFSTTVNVPLGHRYSKLFSEAQVDNGKSLEQSSTYVTCGQCSSSYAIKEDDMSSGKGRSVHLRTWLSASLCVFCILLINVSFLFFLFSCCVNNEPIT
jgi:hypothetical protein